MTLVVVLAIAGSSVLAASHASGVADSHDTQITKQVRHELLKLPYYGVFDNLAYKVEGDTVTLYGQVVRPTTRKDAARNVARIPGVARVINQIEVLPLSGFDDSIRARAYRAVFRSGGLYRYAMGSNPSIHIIVNRGNVSLEGVVGNRMDSQLAYMALRGVPGVFNVTNNLQVEGENDPR
ncbi:MAG TPA: BON domain-containing protein [Pyrinomonadaceae bacterium]|nr:BON domain-containing protein [Pyrinomonadaceae bacterium]